MVSTVAAGNTRDYVGASDVAMMAAVTDVAGINSISGRILANAAAAMAGMVQAPPVELAEERPLIAATMFGVTTPCVTAAREALEAARLRGAGVPRHRHRRRRDGGADRLGFMTGVLDITTTELCDRLVGGVLAAGPSASRSPAASASPRSCSLGALDMVNFGARDTVPPQFEDRNLYVHNPSVTLMRTTPEEYAELGADHRGQARRARAGRWRCSCRSRAFRPSTSKAARSTTRPPTRRCSRRCGANSRTTWSCTSSSTTSTTPSSREAMVDKLVQYIEEPGA